MPLAVALNLARTTSIATSPLGSAKHTTATIATSPGAVVCSRDEERWFLRDDVEERLRHRQRGQREDVAGLSDRPAGDALEHTLNPAPRVEGTPPPRPGDVGRDTYRGPRSDHQEHAYCEDQPEDNGRAD